MAKSEAAQRMMRKPSVNQRHLSLIERPNPGRNQFSLRTIDLFSGAGGITEGFRQEGYECLYGNDLMPEAMQTFELNHPQAWADCRNVEHIDPLEIRTKLNLRKGELDVLVGGPPCQGFSINAPGRFLLDPRNALFRDYVRFLEEFEPKAFLFENVPGLLSLGDGKVLDQIVSEFVRLDYHVTVKILFAAHYGVPQERWRLILMGSRLGEIAPPEPTFFAKGRANFRSAGLTFQLTESDQAWLEPAVTVSDAIRDLPRLDMGEGAEVIGYTGRALSRYAQNMRNPEGFTFNHYAARLSKQNVERMRHIQPGGSWRDIPHHLLPKGMQLARKSDHTKRYGRLRQDGLASTVLTKCDPHWGAVFLPDQNRSLTVREAARFQSFPDTYEFKGSRVSQYEQVGNAVPVLLAKTIAGSIRAHLEAHGCVQAELPEAVNA